MNIAGRMLLAGVLLGGAPAALVAATADDATPLPVEQSAYHVPVFRNEYVTVLRVNIPGQRTTDYHTHAKDSVCVVVENYPPEAYSQPLGGEPGPPRGAALGEVSYIPYYTKTLTHRAINPGTLARHSICTELNSARAHGFTPLSRDAERYTQVLDNARVRAWRLLLAPGQSAPLLTQRAPGLRVIVKGGEIEEASPGRRSRGMVLRQGDVFWQDAGATRAVRNIGTTLVELVEFEYR